MTIKPAFSIICILCLFFIPSAMCAKLPTVSISDGSLTLEVQQMPLRTVLEEVRRQGVLVRIDPAINPLITASFKNRPLHTAFSAILKEFSYSLIWDGAALHPSQEPQLSEIQIFRQGRKEQMQVLGTNRNLAVVQGKNGLFLVKNTLLVCLDAGTLESTLVLLRDAYGATPEVLNSAMGVVRFHLPDGVNIEKLANIISDQPGIVFAEPDYAYPLALARSLPAAPQLAQETLAALPASDGTAVAVLDSGLSESLASSPFISATFDAISPGSAISDPLGHGTQMSLLAAGVVNPIGPFSDTGENSAVVSIRAFDDNGFTSNSALLQGIDYAIEAGARVLSMSWGTETKSLLLQSAVTYATENGLILVAAAGNAPTGKPVYPAAYQDVIAVGALMPDGSRWKDSNYGDFVTLYAPGLAQLPVGYDGDPGMYAGTSIATAYAAHQIAAILAAAPDTDLPTVLQSLVSDHATGIAE